MLSYEIEDTKLLESLFYYQGSCSFVHGCQRNLSERNCYWWKGIRCSINVSSYIRYICRKAKPFSVNGTPLMLLLTHWFHCEGRPVVTIALFPGHERRQNEQEGTNTKGTCSVQGSVKNTRIARG